MVEEKEKTRISAKSGTKISGKKAVWLILACVVLAAVIVLLVLLRLPADKPETGGAPEDSGEQAPAADPEPVYATGYLASQELSVSVYDENAQAVAELPRGTEIEYMPAEGAMAGYVSFTYGGAQRYVRENEVTGDLRRVVREKLVYVRTACSLTDETGALLGRFVEKGSTLVVLGYDGLAEDGSARRYFVAQGGEGGYIAAKYVARDVDSAVAVYDELGSYQTHAGRGDPYGGGDAASLDYYPREEPVFAENTMPDEVKSLYLSCSSWILGEVDEYIAYADTCGINAFVVDIMDGGMVGYASPVMEEYSPTTCGYANNTMEEYGAAIEKLKNAGYYVIGRITTFNDPYFVVDHPECAIRGLDGEPLELNTMYWPTAYSRYAWEYKVSLAVEAVERFGFNEIQFDYVRFPDRTYKYDSKGTIDYINTYGETKAQAIQRFMMYACDRVHEAGAYVGIDVFGECAYGYVTAYGQYWPALSEVVDVICGMPYPDHFSESGSWKPWLHPYETLYEWGLKAVERQKETASPAVVRTWIQAYDAIKSPYNTYGAEEVGDEIRGLHDSGLYGGYMTWNFNCSLDKYRSLAPAFDL